jgi:hypothetical protein
MQGRERLCRSYLALRQKGKFAMKKSVSRNLYLLAILLGIVAGVLFALGLAGGSFTITQGGMITTSNVSNPTFVIVAAILAVVSSILILIAWIGALVRTAQLGRWGWFVCLLVLSGITMLVYIFAGPTTPANPAMGGQYPPPARY